MTENKKVKTFCHIEEKQYFCARLVRKGFEEAVARLQHTSRKTFKVLYLMYAIVEINGQQFKAEAGKKLFVHHIQNVENGATVEFEKVLLVEKDGAITVGAPTVEGAKVVAEVKSELVKGEKVLVFHKKRRKGYRKLNGHRQQFSEIVIKEVIA